MTNHPEKVAAARRPAGAHARFTVVVMTILGGAFAIFALNAAADGAPATRIALLALLPLAAALGGVSFWLSATRPAFAGSRPARWIGRTLWLLAALAIILFALR